MITVRHADATDMDAVLRAGRGLYGAARFESIAPFDEERLRNLVEAADNNGTAVLVAMVDGRTVGVKALSLSQVWFSPTALVAQELFWWVDPEHRGRGVGRALLEAAEKWAQDKGAKLFLAVIYEGSERGPSVCERAGYRLFENTWAKVF